MASVWTPELTARAKVLWDEGHLPVKIGQEIGVSFGAVVKKAQREGWPAMRPGGRPRSSDAPKPLKRAGTTTLAPLASIM